METSKTEPQEMRDNELLSLEFRSKAIVTAIETLSTETASPLSMTEVLDMQPEKNIAEVALSMKGAPSPALPASTSISKLPSEPLPWRPNTRPKLPPGALLDIDQGPMYDILTEWLPFESVCHLDSALCQRSKHRRAEWLAMLSTKVLLFNREEFRVFFPYRKNLLTHRALGAAALNWVLKRGIHLASLRLPREITTYGTAEQECMRDAVTSLAHNGRIDKLETVSLFGCYCIKDTEFAAVLSKCYSSVKSIDIRRCRGLTESAAVHIKRCVKLEAFSANGNESTADMVEILRSCRKLRKVDFDALQDRLTDKMMIKVAVHCSLLEHLSFESCSGVSDAAVSAVAESCPLLQFINLMFMYRNITDASVVSLCNHCPLLKRIYLCKCYNLTDVAVLAMAESLPGLKHIDLAGITEITSSAVETLASKCRELKYISLRRCINVSDAALMKIAEHCSKLEWLYVSNCLLLTDASVLAVAERLSGLTHIDLAGITEITSSAVETLASKCRELKYIRLEQCINVSDATLMKIADHCSKLEDLDVRGCPDVTVVLIRKMFPRVNWWR